MVILRDERRIARMRKISQYASIAGMALLVGGLIAAFTDVSRIFTIQLIALTLGWLLSQVGIYLAQRYARTPRPDQVLDQALQKVARDGRLYHYLLAAPHVLLLKSGIIVFVTKFQAGNISADGDKWKQTGVGLRKFFGQEGLGNPTREAETMVSAVASYIRKNAPEVEEVPVGAVIVFTADRLPTLDVRKSRITAMHHTKVKGFLRQQKKKVSPMSQEDYEAIRAAFDLKAAHLIEPSNGDIT
jgi:hypothetical protein